MSKFNNTIWNTQKIGDLVERVGISVDVNPDQTYREIGIRSHGKGIFHKDEVLGSSLGNKRVFWIEPDCFIVNIVFAWEQAIAITTKAENGFIASHRFPMYKPILGKLDLNYVLYFFKTKRGKHLLELASPGGAGRNKTLGQKAFLDLSIPLPSFAEQQKIAEILGTWETAVSQTEQLIAALQKRKKGLMQRLLTGAVRFDGEKRPLENKDVFPSDWEQAQLGNLGETFNGLSLYFAPFQLNRETKKYWTGQ